MFVHHERDLQFSPDPIGSGYKHRLLIFARLKAKEAAKAPKVGQNFRAKRRSNKRLDAIDELIACIDIHTGITIGRHE